jgi:lysophospholipase L1-like esterase
MKMQLGLRAFVLLASLWLASCGGGGSGGAPSDNEPPPIVILLTGDSLTGSDTTDANLWPNHLTAIAQEKIIRTAVGGDWFSRQYNGSGVWVNRGVVERLRNTLPANPIADAIVLQGGTNDMGGAFDWSSGSSFSHLKFAVTDALNQIYSTDNIGAVIVWNVPYSAVIEQAGQEAYRASYNSWIAQICELNGLVLFDVDALLSPNYPDWYRDDLHPNQIGAQAIASAMDSLLLAASKHNIQAPDTGQSEASWNNSNRTYDGLTISGRVAEVARTTSGVEVLPASGNMPPSGKYYAELIIKNVDASPDSRIGWANSQRQGATWDKNLGDGADNPLPSIDIRNRALIIKGVEYLQETVPTANLQAGETIMYAWDSDSGEVWLGWQGQWFGEAGDPSLIDPSAAKGGIEIGGISASELFIAIETTYSFLTVEFVAEIPLDRIPQGFSIFPG